MDKEKTEKRAFLSEDFEGKAENIYEAILIVSKRARQIGELQKRQIDRALGQTEMMEQQASENLGDEDEIPVVAEPEERIQLHFEKPPIQAMREMAGDKVKWHYEE
ncbi:MAG: DNA-directed RNA polymerase subunit omega [bacterium]